VAQVLFESEHTWASLLIIPQYLLFILVPRTSDYWCPLFASPQVTYFYSYLKVPRILSFLLEEISMDRAISVYSTECTGIYITLSGWVVSTEGQLGGLDQLSDSLLVHRLWLMNSSLGQAKRYCLTWLHSTCFVGWRGKGRWVGIDCGGRLRFPSHFLPSTAERETCDPWR